MREVVLHGRTFELYLETEMVNNIISKIITTIKEVGGETSVYTETYEVI